MALKPDKLGTHGKSCWVESCGWHCQLRPLDGLADLPCLERGPVKAHAHVRGARGPSQGHPAAYPLIGPARRFGWRRMTLSPRPLTHHLIQKDRISIRSSIV